jgi:ubiquinone/menaquinone biosynthesis C-methylase UbiE
MQAEALLELSGPVGGMLALDAGCGTGYFTRLLLARGAQAWGLDRDLDRIHLARAIARSQGLRGLFVAGDILDLPFRSGVFDLVTMVTVLEFLEDKPRAVAEVCRVLRSGGRAVVLALTGRGLWGLGRKLRPRPPYRAMKALGEAELVSLLRPIGPVHSFGFLYAPPWPFLPERAFFWLDAAVARVFPALASMVGAVARKG